MSRAKTPQPEAEIDYHDALLIREAATRKRRIWRRVVLVPVVLAAAAGGAIGARPAFHAVKAWQARRLARQAVHFVEAGDLPAARVKVEDAATLWRAEPEVMYAAAFFLTRAGAYRQAVAQWKLLENARRLSPAELREYANADLNAGDADNAEILLRKAWPTTQKGTRADWALEMQIDLRRNRGADAAGYARQLLADADTPASDRLRAAAVLLAGPNLPREDRALGWKNVQQLARNERSPESLTALIIMAQGRSSWESLGLGEDQPNQAQLIARIDSHPLAKTAQKLAAIDLRIAAEPARKEELIDSAIERFGGKAETESLAALDGWLYGKGEFAKALVAVPLDRAVTDRTLYLQYLDLLAAMGRWSAIRDLIQARKFPLDPMFSELFLARCADQLGEPAVRDARWQGAIDAAGKDTDKLLTVANYAQSSGTTEFAAAALRKVTEVDPEARSAYDALARLYESTGETKKLRTVLAAMLVHWPRDVAVRNDSAYLDALLNENVTAARDTARALISDDPTSLAHRTTLALADLRLGDGLGALDAFKGFDPANSSLLLPREAAVYAATLWQADFAPEARKMLKNAPLNRLSPEEKLLVAPIEGDTNP